MPRRRRHDVVALGLAALAIGLAACQEQAGDAGCQFATEVTLAQSPLTLLSDARLDQIGDSSYELLGLDTSGPPTVRWAALTGQGVLSGEQAYPLPDGVSSAFYAVAGLATPGDTVLFAYLGTDTTGTIGQLAVMAVPADGTVPSGLPTTVVTFPGGIPPAGSVVMTSSRKGMNAGLAWVDAASGQVMFMTLNAMGQPTGAPIAASSATGPISCLSFSPGTDDMTVFFYATTTSLQMPGWVIAEASEGGSIDSGTVLTFNRAMGTCAVLTPTGTANGGPGYALAWQDNEGAWLAEYVRAGSTLTSPYPFASASTFGGPNLQPPLGAMAPFGTDFGVLFVRPKDVELWRLDALGNQRPGQLIFPSINGTFGSVSAFPAEGGLVATYADYSSAVGVTPASGGRVFVNAVCY